MFLEGMKIMLGDKTCVKVEEVVCGDILMTENFAQVKVIAVIDGQEDAVTYIKLQSGGNIVVSVDQKFLTAKDKLFTSPENNFNKMPPIRKQKKKKKVSTPINANS